MDRAPRGSLRGATQRRLAVQYASVHAMTVRDKRSLFASLRAADSLDEDCFLPRWGVFAGEFACFQLLAEHSRRETRAGAAETQENGSPPATV